MDISAALANQNYERYQLWQQPFLPGKAKQAVLAFNGEVYAGLNAPALSEEKLMLAQKKMRILSGLYGVLKPLDLILPYRLEMGTKLGVGKSKDLYTFWGNKITTLVQKAVEDSGSNILVNLASAEYFKSIDVNKLKAEIITPVFKDMKNGKYKFLTFFAKKARGLMTRFILDNNIESPDEMLAFDIEGYHYNPRLSEPSKPVFTRG